jgi:plastocyanin
MRRLTLFLSLFLAAPAAAQEWRTAPEYDVLLTSYAIQPKVLKLKAGEPVRLRFVNNSNEPHRFAAAAFFARAEVPERLRGLVKHGAVLVAPLSEETLVLVPKAGRYGMSGGSLAQRLLGMHGRIVVE